VVLIFNTASNRTLNVFHKQKLNKRTMGIITIRKPDTMNSNASKPDILRQLFKQIVWNNRTSNGRQKDIAFFYY
jgi:hypothetical protein